jgi:hypothetical protein
LPVGQPSECERDDEAGGEAAGEKVAPPCRSAAALGDKSLRLRGGLRRTARPRGDPAFRLLQRRRAQQEPTGTAGCQPAAREFAELGVLPDPADVGLQRLGKLIGACLEAVRLIEENEIQPTQRLGGRTVVNAPAYDRRNALVERDRMPDLLERHLRCHRVGRQQENDSIGARNQRLDARPPILEGVNLAAIDQWLEAAHLESRFKLVREDHVPCANRK